MSKVPVEYPTDPKRAGKLIQVKGAEPNDYASGGSVAFLVYDESGKWIGWVGDGREWRGWRYGGRKWWASWRENGDTAARWCTGGLSESLPTRKAALAALLAAVTEGGAR